MLDWLKALFKSVPVIVGLAVAVFFGMKAHQNNQTAKKYRQKFEDEKQDDVRSATDTAKANLNEADRLDQEAKDHAKKSADKITKAANSNESIADILDRWSKS